MKNFNDLSEREILALAISLEEEDERVYADFFEGLRQEFAASAAVFDSMRKEESEHRRRLIELYRQKFGEHIPLIRRQDVKGFVQRMPVWLVRPLGLDVVRRQASAIEVETRRFYERAAARTQDASIRQLLDDLAQEERSHEDRAEELTAEKLRPDMREDEDKARRRLFVLQIVQPGLAGLMDGSVSTLAPVFAAALGRGQPWLRGLICGAMTTLGGIGHTLPFLIHEFQIALGIAIIVVLVELGVITWVRHRFMDTPVFSAALQVGLGGALVFITGILIGKS